MNFLRAIQHDYILTTEDGQFCTINASYRNISLYNYNNYDERLECKSNLYFTIIITKIRFRYNVSSWSNMPTFCN